MLPSRLGLRFALEALFLLLLAIGAGLADLRPALIVLVMAVAWVLVALIEFTAERIAASPISYILPEPAPTEERDAEQVFWPGPEERTVVAPPLRPAEPEAAEPVLKPETVAEPEPEPEGEPVPEQAAEPQPESLEPPAPAGRRGLLRRHEPEPEEELPEQPAQPEPESLEPPAPVPRRGLLRRREPEPEGEPVPEQAAEPEPESLERPAPARRRRLLRRREPELEEELPEQAAEPEPESLEPPAPARRRRLLRRRERAPEPIPPPPPRHVKLLPRRSSPEPSRAAQEVAELFGSGEDGDPSKREESGT